jgi:hypothetical protein
MSYVAVFKSISESSFQTFEAQFATDTFIGNAPARRPLRGLLIGKETHATMEVMGGSKLMKNSSVKGGESTTTTNFLLQTVTETRNEKVQYVSTFGSTYGFFFGEQPRIVNCSAILLNTPDFNWEKEWWVNYGEVLRGSSLTSSNSKAYLKFDGQTVIGYLTNCTTTKNAQDPNLVNLNFSMFVEQVDYEGEIGSTTPYAGAETRADFLGVGNILDRDDRAVLEESTTAAVRRANIKISALNGGQSIGGLMGALGAIDGAISNFVRQARNALYGRNLVVPRSFIGERASVAVFPEGTGADDLGGQSVSNYWGKNVLTFLGEGEKATGGSSVTLRSNTDGFLTREYMIENQRKNKHTYDNFDEYVNIPPRSETLTDLYKDTSSFLGPEFDLSLRDLTAFADGLIINQKAVDAFSTFGLAGRVLPYVNGLDPVVDYQATQTKEALSGVLRGLARVVYGVATFAYGTSVVNQRRELQASITNPNTGGLDSATLNQLILETSEASRSAEQERLAADAEAELLRGNTGTVKPNLISVIGGIIT